MKLALVYPPLAEASQPYASLPALAAFLRMGGHHQVDLFDTNIEFCLSQWTFERINLAARRLEARLNTLEESSKLSPEAAQEYTLLMTALLKAPHVADRIEGAVRDLRRWETFANLERLALAKRVLQDAAEVLGAESPLLRRRIASFSAGEISRLTKSADANPFGVFFEEKTIPALRLARPRAVGISITYPSQILPAIALARMVRMHMPSAPVILGGQIISVWYDDLAYYPELFDWCDYVVGYEGETALDTLLTAMETGGDGAGIANVATRDGNSVCKGPVFTEDINGLPTPDYSDLPLDKYLAPEPVLLVNTSRGCYWSRCAFCSVSPSMRTRFRMRKTDMVVRDLLELRDRHSVHCITLADDCVPPVMLRGLAQRLAGSGLAWQCEVRFERALDSGLLGDLVAAGCKNLIFGLESYSGRVLECMNKGVRPATISHILQQCREAGLAFNLQFFFGFPGETEAEATNTMEFAAEQLHGAATLSFGQFRLQRGSAIARDPAAFGVTMRTIPERFGVELPYEPVASHALAAGRQLAARILEKAGNRNPRLGIDAHTLLYLYKSGVQAMEKNCYLARAKMTAGEREYRQGGRWKRRASQTVREIRDWQDGDSERLVLYDYELDRAIELSRLAGWMLDEISEYSSIADLVGRAAEGTGLQTEEVEAVISPVLSALQQAGLLEPEDRFNECQGDLQL
jgi:hypothetical protein